QGHHAGHRRIVVLDQLGAHGGLGPLTNAGGGRGPGDHVRGGPPRRPGRRRVSVSQASIEVRDLVVRYGTVVAVRGVSFTVGARSASKLSGGQQQRVALARAFVFSPSVLLFDEPLSNLDAKLRAEMRVELKELQRRLDVTSVYVTHDLEEALAISDRIVVM